MKNYYDVLGVPRTATEDEIKKAFRTLAREHHPDHNHGDDSSEDKFKEINEAYSVLGNKAKRDQYDLSENNNGNFRGDVGNETWGINFDDIFNIFKTINHVYHEHNTQNDIEIETTLSLEECFFGVEKTFSVNRQRICQYCSGLGSEHGEDPVDCLTCNGSGKVTHKNKSGDGFFISSSPCSACAGYGKVIKRRCTRCSGSGFRLSKQKISVKIPAGVGNGVRVRISGEGNTDKRGNSGNLYIKITEKPHARLIRNDMDLQIDLKLTYSDLVLGSKIEVQSIGGAYTISVPPGTSVGHKIRVAGGGMPGLNGDKHGDLIVVIGLYIPPYASKREREIIQDLKKLYD